MKAFMPGQTLSFFYTNHRGERERRVVRFDGIDFGENEWYPEPQWFIRTWDYDREAPRSFAISKIETETLIASER